MGFSAIDQLIARGTTSPMQTALGTMGKVQSLRLGALAPALRQAQTQLAQAQAQQAMAKAKNPFALQPLSGDAAKAMSNIIFKQRFADDPDKLTELTKAHDRTERAANARWWSTVPSNERSQVLGKLKTLGIDQVKATQLLGQGLSMQEIVNMSGATQKPMTSESNVPTGSNASIATPDTIKSDIANVKEHTKPVKWQEIRPNFAPTGEAISKTQSAASASAGLDYLGKYVGNNLNYGGITSKITRPWLQDVYSNNPAKQQKAVDYYTAQAVKPELALLRIKIQGGQPSARAMSVIEPTILGHIQVDMANLPAAMQRRVQLQAVHILNEAARQSELQTSAPNPNIFNSKFDHGQNISSAPSPQAQPTKSPPSQENLEFTAKTRGITVEEVKRRLGIK